MEDYYTPEEVANKLKIDITTVYRWVKEGRLKAIRVGRLLRIPESELQRFLGLDGNKQDKEE